MSTEGTGTGRTPSHKDRKALRTIGRALDSAGVLLNLTGHTAVGTFLTNRLWMGAPETLPKIALIVGHLGLWGLLGLVNSWIVGRRGFTRGILLPGTPGRVWALLFTVLGARWLAQETLRLRHPRHQPEEVLSTTVERHDLRGHVLAYEGKATSGLRGRLNYLNEIYDVEVITHEVALPRLPEEFDGFTILQISDVHHGHFASGEFVRCYIELCTQMAPDLIALTGDYQTYPKDVEYVSHLLAPLGEGSKRERGGEGVVAVLGNHDHEAGAEHVMDALQRAGIRVLNNDNVRIERGAASLYVAGVADPWTPWRVNLDQALLGIPEGACTVLLAHVPDFFVRSAGSRIDLQLAGHNHGGQIKLPVIGPMLVSSRYGRRYAEGFFKRKNTLMYVSRGLGGKPPVRWHSKPEIGRLVMRKT
jgi:uncharacterized protein